MADTMGNTNRAHPLVIVAAITVILTCLVAVAVMTGVVPVSKRTAAPDVANAPTPPAAGAPPQTAFAPPPPARTRTPERPSVGSTSPTAGAGAVGGGSAAETASAPPPQPAHCANCGRVVAVRAIKHQQDSSMLGPAAGALLGGVLGHQIGHGTGNTIATVIGAGAGAAAGTEVERRYRTTTSYVIDVRMDDGAIRHFSSPTAPAVQAGARVKVVDGKLMLA